MPVDLARPAREWSKRGRAQYAGQTLALCVLVCAAHAAGNDGDGAARWHGDDHGQEDPNPIQTAALVVAVELLREEADGEDPRKTRAALEAEIIKQLGGDSDAADTLSRVIDDAIEVYRNGADS